MASPHLLGLDLGGTKIAAGVVSSSGRLLSSVRLNTPLGGVKRDLAALFDAGQTAIRSAGVAWRDIRAVGVGVPGAFDPRSRTVWAPNLPGWTRVPLERLLGRAFRRPVFVEADRNVQALAETWKGSAGRRGVRNLVFITIGTGIGAGIVADGRLVTGSRGVAGAAGWLAVSDTWRPLYGKIGCLEALGAGPAVARLAEEHARRRIGGARANAFARKHRGRITAEVIADAARRGDRFARQLLAEVGANLGRGVASIVALVNPEVVVLGGGLAEAGPWLLSPLRRAARQWGQPLASRQVRIVRSRLGESAGIVGAARFAMLKLQEGN